MLAVAMAQVPPQTEQLLTGWVADAEATHAVLQRWQRGDAGWSAVGGPVEARLGSGGVAWGRGLHGEPLGPPKIEGDGRAPLGVFRIGPAFADPPAPTPTHGWPVLEVSPRDLWVEDPTSELYNTHVRVPEGRPLTDWERSQRMHLGDDAHRLKVVVHHNTDSPVPGQGSAIFLHRWRRDGDAATAGCTAMAPEALDTFVDWLSPAGHPVFVLLTDEAWSRYGVAWGLPSWVAGGTTAIPPEAP